MKRFSFFAFLAIGLCAAALSLTSCQKEEFQTLNPSNGAIKSTDRGPVVYAITVYRPGSPSHLITMDLATGTVQNDVTVSLVIPGLPSVALDDLKGVCVYNDQVWLSTGPNANPLYSNLLVKVLPTTGQAGYISQSTVGTVSDIDYDPGANTVYGLLDNNNRLVTINDNANNWATYNVVGNITNLGANYTAKGLSMARDNAGTRIIVAATQGIGGNAQVYSEPAAAGAATFLAAVNPAADLSGANCGIGFQISNSTMQISRNAGSGSGANSFAWTNPLVAPVSAYWGGLGSSFEDFSSALQ